jgi:hypothetical protein
VFAMAAARGRKGDTFSLVIQAQDIKRSVSAYLLGAQHSWLTKDISPPLPALGA